MIEVAAPPAGWQTANQRALAAALAAQRLHLEAASAPTPDRSGDLESAERQYRDLTAEMSRPPAFETLAKMFGLSPFERAVVLLCAGAELDSSFAAACAAAHGNAQQTYPTFGLALATLADAHWSALAPDAPLRYWRLVEFAAGGSPGAAAASPG
jgi:hypothetical protein